MKTVVYKDGNQEIAFNAEWAASKSVTDFITHEKHHGLTDAQLKEVHGLCKKAVATKPEAPAPETT